MATRQLQLYLCLGTLFSVASVVFGSQVKSNPAEDCIVFSTRRSILKSCMNQRNPTTILHSSGGKKNIVAIDADYKNGCIYYSNVFGYSLEVVCFDEQRLPSENIRTIRTSSNSSLSEGIAYDWIGGNVYWIEKKTHKLGVTSKDGKFSRVLYEGTDIFDSPRGLVLHPGLGLLFWTDWSDTKPRIVRASMNGDYSSIKVLREGRGHLGYVNDIALDFKETKLYWNDAKLDVIGAMNIDGSNPETVLNLSQAWGSHMFGITVTDNYILWSDWRTNNINAVNKTNLSDISHFYKSVIQPFGLSAWAEKPDVRKPSHKTPCRHLYLLGHNSTTGNVFGKCYCGDENNARAADSQSGCIGGLTNRAISADISGTGNGPTQPAWTTCDSGEFNCDGTKCFPDIWLCDGDPDCADGTDEVNCTIECSKDQFNCGEGECVPVGWICDGDKDCPNGSDEANCTSPESTKQDCIVFSAETIFKTCMNEESPTAIVGRKEGQKILSGIDTDYTNGCIYYSSLWFRLNSSIKTDVACFEEQSLPAIKARTLRKADGAMIEGIAYDWITKNVYWLEKQTNKLGVTSGDGKFSRVLYAGAGMFDEPRGLALHPGLGLLFWTDWSGTKPRIVRASMNGDYSSIKVLLEGQDNLKWVNHIALDFTTEKLYWTDARLNIIGAMNIDGSNKETVINFTNVRSSNDHLFGIAVTGNYIFWSEWDTDSINAASKTNRSDITLVYKSDRQPFGLSTWTEKPGVMKPLHKTPCRYLYLLGHNSTTGKVFGECYCADENKPKLVNSLAKQRDCIEGVQKGPVDTDRPTGTSKLINATKEAEPRLCAAEYFKCDATKCLPQRWVCDGERDCADGTDERNCTKVAVECSKDQFRCSGRCIPASWVCDGEKDCSDGSDEAANCTSPESTKRNISATPQPMEMPKDCLLYTSGKSIHRFCLYNNTHSPFLKTHMRSVMDFDVDYSHRCVFYTGQENSTYSIKEYCPNNSWRKLVHPINVSSGVVEGVAYDWVGQNIYWLDNKNHVIMVTDRTGNHTATLYKGETILQSARDLVLYPEKGLLYWLDWPNSTAAVMQASMAGENASIKSLITNNLGWPVGLALDTKLGQLFWADTRFDKIIMFDLNAQWSRAVRILPSFSLIYGLSVSERFLYWSDRRNASIFAIRRGSSSTEPVSTIVTGLSSPKRLNVVSRETKTPQPCPKVCPHLCLVSYNIIDLKPERVCRCADGFVSTVDTCGHPTCQPVSSTTETSYTAQTISTSTAAPETPVSEYSMYTESIDKLHTTLLDLAGQVIFRQRQIRKTKTVGFKVKRQSHQC